VLRGETHCSAVTLRVLAMERVVRAVLLSLAVYAVLRFRASPGSIQAALDRDALIHELQHALTAQPSWLTLVAALLAGYAATEAVEAAGLWLLSRWGSTSPPSRPRCSCLWRFASWPRARHAHPGRGVTINIAAVMYLLLAKYLFGLRGGRKAYDRERRGEQLSEVERIALGSDPRAGSGAPPEGSTADRDHALAGPDHGVDAKRPVRGSTRLFPRRSRVSSARSPVRS